MQFVQFGLRSEILDILSDFRSALTRRDEFQNAVRIGNRALSHRQHIAYLYLIRRFAVGAADKYAIHLARLRRIAARLVYTHGPEPLVYSYAASHAVTCY